MVDIKKSPADERTYLYRRMDNGVKCVVISDPETDMSAAAMAVAAGSLRDPREIQGLSHFLEHMLFLGTEKYPDENTYNTYIKENSGDTNAYTAHQSTNYFFTVAKDKLEKALDIFAQFFIAPLFTESCVDREMHAVDSENAKNHKNDIWRLHQLMCSMATPGHEFNHFATGNLQTLQVPDIRDKLISHYKANYSADLMAFVLLGKEDVNTLMSWCEEHFSKVPTYAVPRTHEVQPMPFDRSRVGTLTRAVSIMDKKELKLVWQFPGVIDLYDSKPDSYLSHLLGHEGTNSILSMLKDEGLGLELTAAGDWYSYEDYCLFMVLIDLTEKGMREYERVMEIVFQYISMLRERGVQEWVFEEKKNLAKAKFQFQSKTNPEDYTCTLASSLHKYPPEKILTAPCLVETYQPELFARYISYLTPDNMLAYLISQEFDQPCTDTEQWYETKYSTEAISPPLMDRLLHPNITHPTLKLDLPPRNLFIPDSFQVLPPGTTPHPVLVLDSNRMTVHHKQDDTFKKDEIHGFVYLRTLDSGYSQTALGNLCGRLWKKLFFDHIRELNYMGKQAGLELDIVSLTFGIGVRATGFSQHYEEFMLEAFKQLAEYQVTDADQKVFQEHYEELKRDLENNLKKQTYEQVLACYNEVMFANGLFTNKELLTDLPQVDFEDFKYFAGRWLRTVHFDWLLYGNITAEGAISIAQKCEELMVSKRQTKVLAKSDLPWELHREVPACPQGAHLAYETDLSEATDENSCIFSYWQAGPETLPLHAQLLIVENVLNQPCFAQLRTEKQLGYLVWSVVWSRRQVMGLGVIIQSHVAAPLALAGHIVQFLEGMKPTFGDMSDETFATHKESVYKEKVKKDVQPRDEFARYEAQVTSGVHRFDKKAALGAAIEATTKDEVKRMFEWLFFTENRRLDIQFVSANLKAQQTAGKGPMATYSSVYRLRNTLPTYPATPL